MNETAQREDVNLEEFGSQFRTLRESFGVSMKQLVRDTGVPFHTIKRLERGEIPNPGMRDLVALGQYFGLSPNDIARWMGLIPQSEVDDEETETGLGPEATSTLETVRNYLMQLDEERQARVATMIAALIYADQRVESIGVEREDAMEEMPNLPEWLIKKTRKRRLLPIR